MTVTETIPLPSDRASAGRPFEVRVNDLHAWPQQELIAVFEYNEYRERWTWDIEHARYGRLWPKGTAVLDRRYTFWPYFMARFIDTSGEAEAVTPENLGETVVLGVYPGPLGGEFHPDSDIDAAEADQLLSRHWFDPVR